MNTEHTEESRVTLDQLAQSSLILRDTPDLGIKLTAYALDDLRDFTKDEFVEMISDKNIVHKARMRRLIREMHWDKHFYSGLCTPMAERSFLDATTSGGCCHEMIPFFGNPNQRVKTPEPFPFLYQLIDRCVPSWGNIGRVGTQQEFPCMTSLLLDGRVRSRDVPSGPLVCCTLEQLKEKMNTELSIEQRESIQVLSLRYCHLEDHDLDAISDFVLSLLPRCRLLDLEGNEFHFRNSETRVILKKLFFPSSRESLFLRFIDNPVARTLAELGDFLECLAFEELHQCIWLQMSWVWTQEFYPLSDPRLRQLAYFVHVYFYGDRSKKWSLDDLDAK